MLQYNYIAIITISRSSTTSRLYHSQCNNKNPRPSPPRTPSPPPSHSASPSWTAWHLIPSYSYFSSKASTKVSSTSPAFSQKSITKSNWLSISLSTDSRLPVTDRIPPTSYRISNTSTSRTTQTKLHYRNCQNPLPLSQRHPALHQTQAAQLRPAGSAGLEIEGTEGAQLGR
jgi:hypothetical protein